MPVATEILDVAGRQVALTNPGKIFFPNTGHTKLDLVRYYMAVADGAIRGVAGRPMALKRFVNGAGGEFFFQKRAPSSRPEWVETVELSFPSGRTAHEVVVRDAAHLAWVVNLGCIDLNPHPVRAQDLDHPDELRIDLDPVPGVAWSQIREVALVAKEVLEAFGLVGWPKTSGSRGFHIYCRIEPRWTFMDVRRAAVELSRPPTLPVPRQTPAYRPRFVGKRWRGASRMSSRSTPSPSGSRRPATHGRRSTMSPVRSSRSSSLPPAMRPPGWPTHHGRPTSTKRPVRRLESSPPGGERMLGRPCGRGWFRRRRPVREVGQRAGAGPRCRFWRSPGRPRKPRRGTGLSGGEGDTPPSGRC